MNILLIGNGFDLAHGLPTKYGQCLEFLDLVNIAAQQNFSGGLRNFTESRLSKADLPSEIIDYIKKIYIEGKISDPYVCEIEKLMFGNFWYAHFLSKILSLGENWIDFELEIGKIISLIDEIYFQKVDTVEKLTSMRELRKCIDSIRDQGKNNEQTVFNQLRDKLYNDLNNFIRCMELYFTICLDKIQMKDALKDIKNIGTVDRLLSFNYTDTFERIYQNQTDSTFDKCYIHGKIDASRPIVDNNMVLGIEEDPKYSDTEGALMLIQFKKYYQRIHKETDYNYVNWMNSISSRPSDPRNLKLYIFGHSLDITDKEILRDLILRENVETHIFYPDKKRYGQQITNLVKVIGYKELNERTRGINKTIFFQKQQS